MGGMHTRRLATFLLGAWITGSLFMGFVAIQNFEGVNRVLEAPVEPAQRMIQILTYWPARSLLRYQASEFNRFYFERWEWTQIILGVALAITLLVGTRGNWIAVSVCLFMLLLVLFQRFFVMPEITWSGRALDFDSESPLRGRFVRLHVIYSAVEITKMVLAFGLTTYLFAFRGRLHSRSSKEVNAINHAHHGHIDR